MAPLAFACGSTPAVSAGAATPNRVETKVERYLPLPADFVYTYDTYSDGQLVGSLWMQIEHPRAGRVDLKMGNRTTHLQLQADGVSDITGGWLLKAPLQVGAEFQGKNGKVRITRTDVALETKAGSFRGCIETQEEAGGVEASSRVTTLYCPDVGIAQLDIMTQEGTQLIEERAVLRSFAKRVDINALGDSDLESSAGTQ
jgi:hypothetical protein